MNDRPDTPLLDTVNFPADIRGLAKDQLPELADQLRQEVISAVSVTGGHLGAGLGVVELPVALHYVFNTPDDKLIWDVGHQAYPHKIVTGRRDRIRTLRQGGGLSGFTRRAESEYDPFGAAHSSTSMSSALGFAIANKLSGDPGKAVAVIGDGALSAGMAYEAMNNAAAAGNRLIVILNDNDMSIAPPVGSLRNSLARLVSSNKYLAPRKVAQKIARMMPEAIHDWARKAEEYTRGWVTGGTLFEELGFYYVGPVDGHDVRALVEVLENVRDAEIGPMLVHVVTQKGKGYAPAENSADKYHGVVKFDVVSGVQAKAAAGAPSYTAVYAKALTGEMERDAKVVAIPNLPVRFAMDRAGLVGADGATHCGAFDLAYLCTLPNFVVMAAADEAELVNMVHTMALHDSGPIAVRYPRGEGRGVPLPERPQALEIGKGSVVREGKKVAILSLGTRLAEAEKAADQLDAMGLSTTVADLRFAKPLDSELIRRLLATHEVAVTVEEASIGGLGAHVLTLASDEGLVDAGLKIRTMRLPDRFQEHDKPEKQYDEAGLNAPHIVDTVLKALRVNSAGVEEVRA